MRPLTSIFSTGQMPDGSGFYSRQMPHYVEPNRGQMPGGCPGGGMIALGIDWYIRTSAWEAKISGDSLSRVSQGKQRNAIVVT